MALIESLFNLLQDIFEFLLCFYRNEFLFRFVLFILFGFFAIKAYRNYRLNKRRNLYPKDKVILHQFPQTSFNYKVPSLSPFALKLETWLRMAKVDYENEFGFVMSAKGKSPWITYNTIDIADSQFSIEYLSSNLNINLAKDADSKEKAAARAFFKLAEDSIYPCVALCRFKYYMSPTQSGMPKVLLSMMRKKVLRFYMAQGYGKHTREEIFSIARKDLKAIDDFIGDKKYLTGDEVCNEDASLFAILSLLIYQDCGIITEYAKKECPNLIRYVDTIKTNFWPDWNEIVRQEPINSKEFLLNYLNLFFFP